MPDGGKRTDLNPGVVARTAQAARNFISAVKPAAWFGPLQPLKPMAPADVKGRRFDYPVGYHLDTRKRGYEPVSFNDLRALADNCDVLNLVIEKRKDQMEALPWGIRPKHQFGSKKQVPVTASQQRRIDQITEFLQSPDKEVGFPEWQRQILDDEFVIDQVAIYRRRDRRGRLYALEVMDGALIKPLLNDDGRRPVAPDPAYQQCYSEDTEVLTRRGWLPFKEVNPALDEIATRNPKTKAFEWQKTDRIVENPYEGPMYRFSSRFLDIMVSPEHRMLVSRLPRGLGPRPKECGEQIITAAQLAQHGTSVTAIPMVSEWSGTQITERRFPENDPSAARLEKDDEIRTLRLTGISYEDIAERVGVSPMTAYRACTLYAQRERLAQPRDSLQIRISGDDFAAFMGAYLGEGSCNLYNGNVVLVAQKPFSKGFAEYRELLERIAPSRIRYLGDSFQIYSKPLVDYLRQFGHARDKWIPEEIMNATPEQPRIFWHHYHLGDGAAERPTIFTSSKRMADQLQEVAQKIGAIASVYTRPPGTSEIVEGNTVRVIQRGTAYVVSLREAEEATISDIEVLPYVGKIWCVSVPNSIIFVRRNGKPAWCGNCLHGIPAADYTSDELAVFVHNPRSWKVYGRSEVEQILVTVNIAIRRSLSQLDYYTEGSQPDAFMAAPKEWTLEQVKQFQAWLDSALSGNSGMRRRLRMIPGDMKYQETKLPPQKDVWDEWLARIVCFAFSIPPEPFIQTHSRAGAESSKDKAAEEGLGPLQLWFAGIVNRLIMPEFNSPDLEFAYLDDRETDPQIAAEIDASDGSNGFLTIDEIREKRGLNPYGGAAATLMVKTATGYVPIDAFEAQQATAQANAEALANKQPGVVQNGTDKPDDKNQPQNAKPGKVKKYALGKAVRHEPVPFPNPTSEKAVAHLTSRLAAILKRAGEDSARQAAAALQRLGKAADDDEDGGDTPRTPESPADAAIAADDAAMQITLGALDDVPDAAQGDLFAVAQHAGGSALAQLGTDTNDGIVGVVNDAAVDYARTRSAEMIGKAYNEAGDLIDNPDAEMAITDSTRDMIRKIIADGLEQGSGRKEIADQIETSTAFSSDRAGIIARTEVAGANSMSALAAYQASEAAGMKIMKEWYPDAEACPICLENADEGPIPLEEEFPSGDLAPTAHPSCECVLIPVVENPD